MSDATATTVIAGGLGIVGVVVGLIAERLLHRIGEVQCMIEEDGWRVERGRGGRAVEERRLRVAFLNRKELDPLLSGI
jgi:hypothetical protein